MERIPTELSPEQKFENVKAELALDLEGRTFLPKYHLERVRQARVLRAEYGDVGSLSLEERKAACVEMAERAVAQGLLPEKFFDSPKERVFHRLQWEGSDWAFEPEPLHLGKREGSATPSHPDAILACCADVQGMLGVEILFSQIHDRLKPFGSERIPPMRWISVAKHPYQKELPRNDSVSERRPISPVQQSIDQQAIAYLGRSTAQLHLNAWRELTRADIFRNEVISSRMLRGEVQEAWLKWLDARPSSILRDDQAINEVRQCFEYAYLAAQRTPFLKSTALGDQTFATVPNPHEPICRVYRDGYLPMTLLSNVVIMREVPDYIK
ncbi:hypothetical protein KBD34_04565 [Patescibacteria group bacterium]|nr:hypothetical protein [Patescibacteria group bacterium]